MKRVVLLLGICWVIGAPMTAAAQGMSAQQRAMIEKLQNMTPEQREAFMATMQRQAQQAQSCFENVDPSKVKALEARGREVKSRIDALCDAGRAREAEALAMREGREMMRDPTVQELSRCSQGFREAFDFSPDALAARGGSVCE